MKHGTHVAPVLSSCPLLFSEPEFRGGDESLMFCQTHLAVRNWVIVSLHLECEFCMGLLWTLSSVHHFQGIPTLFQHPFHFFFHRTCVYLLLISLTLATFAKAFVSRPLGDPRRKLSYYTQIDFNVLRQWRKQEGHSLAAESQQSPGRGICSWFMDARLNSLITERRCRWGSAKDSLYYISLSLLYWNRDERNLYLQHHCDYVSAVTM